MCNNTYGESKKKKKKLEFSHCAQQENDIDWNLKNSV